MSDLDGTLSAITLEHLNHPDGPQRVTITADGCTYFVRDTINVCGPRGPYSTTEWVKDRRMDRAVAAFRSLGTPMTPAQMKALSASMERHGWDQIAMGWHGLPSAGRIQR
jgi:hypothetical protein